MYAPGSIGGNWRGVYYYSSDNEQQLPPTVFEAYFSIPNEAGDFDGQLRDNGPLGEADAHGQQFGAQVRFVKRYQNAPAGFVLTPIRYDGTLSPDGSRITGTWELSARRLFGLIRNEAHGIWEAGRIPATTPDKRANDAFTHEIPVKQSV